MKQIELPKNISIITKQNLRLLYSNITENTFNQNIKNWLNKGKLIALKKGLYIFRKYYEQELDKTSYQEFLANQIYFPSYLSKEYILQKYNILTEAVFIFTSVSLNGSRNFRNKLGTFNYVKIKKELFLGFQEKKYFNNKIYIASKAKALFDYLYFYKRRMKIINKKEIGNLRLNLEEMDKKGWLEFEKYLKISKSKKLQRIYNLLIS